MFIFTPRRSCSVAPPTTPSDFTLSIDYGKALFFKRRSARIYRERCPIKKTKPRGGKKTKKKTLHCSEEQSSDGLIVAALLLSLFIRPFLFFLSIQTSGHYRLTAVCRQVGRNLLSLQITAHCRLPLSLHTCTLKDVIKSSVFVVVVVEQDQWCRNVRLR